jgi:hypothetical protein
LRENALDCAQNGQQKGDDLNPYGVKDSIFRFYIAAMRKRQERENAIRSHFHQQKARLESGNRVCAQGIWFESL